MDVFQRDDFLLWKPDAARWMDTLIRDQRNQASCPRIRSYGGAHLELMVNCFVLLIASLISTWLHVLEIWRLWTFNLCIYWQAINVYLKPGNESRNRVVHTERGLCPGLGLYHEWWKRNVRCKVIFWQGEVCEGRGRDLVLKERSPRQRVVGS
jgi:hypothetical protein